MAAKFRCVHAARLIHSQHLIGWMKAVTEGMWWISLPFAFSDHSVRLQLAYHDKWTCVVTSEQPLPRHPRYLSSRCILGRPTIARICLRHSSGKHWGLTPSYATKADCRRMGTVQPHCPIYVTRPHGAIPHLLTVCNLWYQVRPNTETACQGVV